jgi:hypothetical protein
MGYVKDEVTNLEAQGFNSDERLQFRRKAKD